MGDNSGDRYLRSRNQTTSKDKPSAQQLFNVVRRAILNATEPTHLTYDNVDADAGSLIIESLDNCAEIENISPR